MTDPQDFEQLVLRYQGVVCAVAFSVLRDRARSEEVAQEAFLIAWQKLPTMSTPPAMPGWLCGISRNLAANAARRRKETAMDDRNQHAASNGTPLDALLDHETEVLAREALTHLGDHEREVLVLYYRGDGSVSEVASTLGISEPAARQRLHRGRERLKDALAVVETTLRKTRPGPAFTAACIAALATRGALAHAGGSTSVPRVFKPLTVAAFAIPAVVAVALGGAYAIARATTSTTDEPVVVTAPMTPTPTTRGQTLPLQRIDSTARAALLDQIAQHRTLRTRTPAPAIVTARVPDKIYDFSGGALDDVRPITPPAPGPLSKATLKFAIRTVQPLLLECYTARRPVHTAGTLAVVLTLTGEPELGTLVESVKLDGEPALLADTELAECLQETLLSIELPAMPEGGVWEVHYPFTLPAG